MVQHADIDHTGIPGIPAGAGTVTTAYKVADEIVNTSAALQNDDHLLFAVAASEVWDFQISLFFDSGTTPDIKFAITVPAGATLLWAPTGQNDGGTAYEDSVVQTVSGTAFSQQGTGVGTIRHCRIAGVVICGATPGNVQLQWAQNTSNGSNTTVKAGSNLKAFQLA
jgi:hypothetical protein